MTCTVWLDLSVFIIKVLRYCRNISLIHVFQDREAAAKMFKGKKGQALAADLGKRSKTFVPGEKLPEKRHEGPTKEDVAAIKVKFLHNFIFISQFTVYKVLMRWMIKSLKIHFFQ